MNYNEKVKSDIDDAEFVLIGIGEEFFLNCKKFENQYKDLIFDDRMKELQLEPIFKEILLKRWIENSTDERLSQAYANIAQICNNKNYYIVSLGTDDYIYQWGLENVVTPCGGRKRFQRKVQGRTELLDLDMTETLENEIYEAFSLKDFEKLVCFNEKHKDEMLDYNNIFSAEYNESGYMENWSQYLKWIQGTVNRRVCVLELGVSLRLPSVIRWPFEKIAFYNNKAMFYRINERLYQMTAELKDKGISIPENSVTFFGNLFV